MPSIGQHMMAAVHHVSCLTLQVPSPFSLQVWLAQPKKTTFILVQTSWAGPGFQLYNLDFVHFFIYFHLSNLVLRRVRWLPLSTLPDAEDTDLDQKPIRPAQANHGRPSLTRPRPYPLTGLKTPTRDEASLSTVLGTAFSSSRHRRPQRRLASIPRCPAGTQDPTSRPLDPTLSLDAARFWPWSSWRSIDGRHTLYSVHLDHHGPAIISLGR